MSQIGQNSSYGLNVTQWRIQSVLCKHEYENYINYGNLHGFSLSLKFIDFYSDITFFMMYSITAFKWRHLIHLNYELHCKFFIRVSKKDLTIKAFVLFNSLFVTSLLNLCGILNIFTIIILFFLFSKNTNTEHSIFKTHPATPGQSAGLGFTHH